MKFAKNMFCCFFLFFICPINSAAFPFDLTRIKDHIDRKFSEAKLELDPFPHLVITEILPPDVYSYLVAHWPDEGAFDNNSSVRKRLPVTQGCAESRLLIPEQYDAWKTFGEIIVQNYIQDNVKKIFTPLSHYKFPFLSESEIGSLMNILEFDRSYSDGLNLDKFGFSINPHIDQAYIFTSILIYFPPDDQHAQFGTTLYRSKKGSTARDIVYSEFRDCTVAKKVPFLPNTILIYLQTPNGWHGVEAVNETEYLRKSYLSLLNLKYELVESVYGQDTYKASDLYRGEYRYLDARNFNK